VDRPIVRLEGVTYSYPGASSAALREVDLEIGSGLTLVAGGSGGGKSTLLRLLDGLVPQFHGGRISGRATVAGLDPFRVPIPRLAERVGLLFQDVEAQSVYGTVEREVAFGLENAGMDRAQMHDRVDEALAAMAIAHLRGRRLTTLSGGERQRVQLAAILASRPVLVALDEPTSQLDPDGAASVLAACLELARDGRAVVVAEHRLEPLLGAADRLLLVDGGRVGLTTAESYRSAAPPEPAVARPVGPAGGAWELRDVVAAAGGPSTPVVLKEISLAGATGEVVAVIGPNGSGKTTLLRTLAGLIPALAGTVRRPDGRTAYLPQNPGALLHLPTLRAEVELTLRRVRANGFHRLDRSAEEPAGRAEMAGAGRGTAGSARSHSAPAGSLETADEMLAAFGLGALAASYPRDLSSGQRQRAALAATLAGSPALVLLDEPTRGMDVAARRYLAAAVRRLTETGASVVVATHDSDLVAEIADRTIGLRDGRAVEVPR
jgi:energy-coupling factor transport system ATP-binding protein